MSHTLESKINTILCNDGWTHSRIRPSLPTAESFWEVYKYTFFKEGNSRY